MVRGRDEDFVQLFNLIAVGKALTSEQKEEALAEWRAEIDGVAEKMSSSLDSLFDAIDEMIPSDVGSKEHVSSAIKKELDREEAAIKEIIFKGDGER